MADFSPQVLEAFSYAEAVCAGRIIACRLVQLACRRFLDNYEEAANGRGPWEFRADLGGARSGWSLRC